MAQEDQHGQWIRSPWTQGTLSIHGRPFQKLGGPWESTAGILSDVASVVGQGERRRDLDGVTQHGLPKARLKLVYASYMKRMVTGSGAASKEKVGNIVRAILKTDEADEHVLDALGLALCGLQMARVKRREKEMAKEMGK